MTFDVKTNPAKPTITHDPDAYLDYTWDFTDLIPSGDSIDVAVFKMPIGVTVDQITVVGMAVVGWVKVVDTATFAGTTVPITCHYTSVQAREDDRTLYFKIKDR